MSHAAGVGAAVPARDRAGDAAAAGQHARARPQRLPARCSWTGCWRSSSSGSTRSCRSRGASARRATSRRSRISRCRSSAGARSSSAATVVPALIALREAGLEPLELQAKEGLALLNGTQMMGAIGALLLADADRLTRTARVAAAMSVEALLGTDVAFAAAYQLARPHPGPDRGRRRAPPPAPRQRAPAQPPRARPTRSRTRTRCAACRRSTARSATRSTTSAASSTSS